MDINEVKKTLTWMAGVTGATCLGYGLTNCYQTTEVCRSNLKQARQVLFLLIEPGPLIELHQERIALLFLKFN